MLNGDEPVSALAWLSTAISDLFNVVSTCITQITGNAFLAMFLAASAVTLGFRIFRSAKKTAKR